MDRFTDRVVAIAAAAVPSASRPIEALKHYTGMNSPHIWCGRCRRAGSAAHVWRMSK